MARNEHGIAPSRPEDYDRVDVAVIRQRWDQRADRWDVDLLDLNCHLNEDDAYQRFLQTASSVVERRHAFCRRSGLVDLGCGTGLVLEHLHRAFDWSVGVDISHRMLDVARSRCLTGAQFVVGNCFELASFVPNAGVVVSRGILLSHYGDRWAGVLLRQVRRILVEPGSFALFDFLNAEARSQYRTAPENKTFFSSAELLRIAVDSGFRRCSILGEIVRRNRILLVEA